MSDNKDIEERVPDTFEEGLMMAQERREQVRRNATTTLEKIANFFGVKTYGSNWDQAVINSELLELPDKVDENDREEFFSKVESHADQVTCLFVSVVRDCPRKKEVFITMRGMFAFEILRAVFLKDFDSTSHGFGRHPSLLRIMYNILNGVDPKVNRLVEEEKEKKGIPQDSYNTYRSHEDLQRRFEEFLKYVVLMAKNARFSKKCVSDLQFFVEIPREERNEVISYCRSLNDEVFAKFEGLNFTKRAMKANKAFNYMGKLLITQTKKMTTEQIVVDYQQGKDCLVGREFKKAAEFFQKAAEQGHAIAQYHLGYAYYNGEGVEEDEFKAFEWWFKSAEQENVDAIGMLKNFTNQIYYKQAYRKENNPKKFDWLSNAAEQGYSIAQFNLGILYLEGDGITKNEKIGVGWVRKAAEQGLTRAQEGMEYFYRIGVGVEKDEKESQKWNRKAGE